MFPFSQLDRLEELRWLDPVANAVRPVVHKLVRPAQLKDLLHGVWLGHPLHPVLVQLPIGAYLSAGVLDLLPGEGLEPAADALAVVGLVSTVPAVAAGLTDWADLNPSEGRSGLVHAAANVTGTGLWLLSTLARRKGRRVRGKVLGFAGLSAVMVGGVIGGHLSYRRSAGANHNADIADVGPVEWTDVGEISDLPDGLMTVREAAQVPVLLLRSGDRVHALVDRCSHQSGPLHEGELRGGSEPCVVCPWHGSTFRLRDGAVVHGPSVHPQPAVETRTQNGRLEVRLKPSG